MFISRMTHVVPLQTSFLYKDSLRGTICGKGAPATDGPGRSSMAAILGPGGPMAINIATDGLGGPSVA